MASQELGWERQLTPETRLWEIEWAPAEDAGDVIGSITSTLTDLLTGLSYPAGLLGSPTFSGTTVQQAVTALQAGHNYRLMFSANMGGVKVSSQPLLLSCPY